MIQRVERLHHRAPIRRRPVGAQSSLGLLGLRGAGLIWALAVIAAFLASPALTQERELDDNPPPSSAGDIETPIERVFPKISDRPPLFPDPV